ncbi:hypothetical protein [Bosea sp. BIWAKO-01]|uniref:glycine-rich domain-containing protein n=1 Tax=Bosea sp. BIWAKO-01 TaxID=506668 RepID=UPI00085312D4|nr:hypothetical protein [Bosea sp. BIWAKO-01]
MLYQPPTGGAANDPYVGANPGAGIVGSKVPPKAIEHHQRELIALITKSNRTPSESVLTQVADSVRSCWMNWRTAGGTANALTVTLDPAPAAWSDLVGMPLNILLTATNTGAATLAVAGVTGTKSILRPGGAALLAGDLGVGGILRGIYDGTAIQMAGLTQNAARTTLVYSTPGTTAWVCPAGVFRVRAQVWAGGGGGGGAASAANSVASAAGGGEYREGDFPVTPGTSYNVVVGAGGASGLGVGPTNGGSGGTSSFGSLISALGGVGGTAANGAIQAGSGAGGVGGSGGTINRPGMGGGIAYSIGAGLFVLAQGGPSYTGNFTNTVTTGVAVQGPNGSFPGGGASGGALFANGGVGSGGQVILEF